LVQVGKDPCNNGADPRNSSYDFVIAHEMEPGTFQRELEPREFGLELKPAGTWCHENSNSLRPEGRELELALQRPGATSWCHELEPLAEATNWSHELKMSWS